MPTFDFTSPNGSTRGIQKRGGAASLDLPKSVRGSVPSTAFGPQTLQIRSRERSSGLAAD